MATRPLRLAAPALLVLFALACRPASTEPVFEPCPAGTQLTITAGPAPEFSWQPDCGINMLWVAPWPDGTPEPQAADGVSNVWSGRERIRPPVRYGVVPPGMATQVEGAAPALESRVRYQVWIAHRVGHGGVVARAFFIP